MNDRLILSGLAAAALASVAMTPVQADFGTGPFGTADILACWDFTDLTPGATLADGERLEDGCGSHDARVNQGLAVVEGIRSGDGALAFDSATPDAALFDPGFDFGDGGPVAAPGFDFVTGDDITVEALIRVPSSFNGAGSIVSKDVGPGQASWWFRVNNGILQGFVGDGDLQESIAGSIPVNDGLWHHVALVRQAGDSLSLYVDYQLDASESIPAQDDIATPANTPIVIGAFNSGARQLEGDVQMARIARSALPPEAFLLYDQVARLSVSIDHDGEPLIPGGTTDFIVTVRNLGPSITVANLPVEALMPAGVANASWTCVAGAGATCTASGTGNLVDTVGLAPNTDVVYTIETELELEPPPLIVYTASIDSTGYTDPSLDDNEAAVAATISGGGVLRLYVDRAKAEGGNGATWPTAFRHLQTALSAARNLAPEYAVEIWVKEGVYRPNEGTSSTLSRTAAFELANGISLYGGFEGGETELDQRDWLANPTVLSGDIQGDDTVNAYGVTEHWQDIVGLNSYHIVRALNVTSARLDGFHVTGGNADGGGLINGYFLMRNGAGVYLRDSDFMMANLYLVGNRANDSGGGLYAEQFSGSSLAPHLADSFIVNNQASLGGGATFKRGTNLIERTRFEGNQAGSGGGGLYTWISRLDMHNSVVRGNSAEYGGGILQFRTTTALVGSQISGNYASQDGGAISFGTVDLAQPLILTNMTISGNRAGGVGGAVYKADTGGENSYANNTIIWGNQDSTGVGTPSATHGGPGAARLTSSHSLLQGLDPLGDGNFDGTDPGSAPAFVVAIDPADAPSNAGNLRIAADSPLIDAGDNQARINRFYSDPSPIPIEGNILFDLDGAERIVDGDGDSIDQIDLGSYESLGVQGYSVGGTVSGLAGSGLQLQNNGNEILSIESDGDFAFSITLPDAAVYEVSVLTQPDEPVQTCSISNASGSIDGTDVIDIEVDCITDTFTVGGNVSGLAGTGLVLQNNGGDDLAIAANGAFEFATELTDGSAYKVTVVAQPGSPLQTCGVVNATGVIDGADVDDVQIDCVTDLFSVGGTVTGLSGPGLILRNNGQHDLAIDATSGAFEFDQAWPSKTPYEVTISRQPDDPLQHCSVINGSGTIVNNDVTDVQIECLDRTDTIFNDRFDH